MRVFSVVLLALVAVGCNKDITAAPPAALREVTVEATQFTPNNVTIRQGGTVRFQFLGTAHNVVFTEQAGRPENIEVAIANITLDRVFGVEGTYAYTCTEHQAMTGTVTVRAVEATDEE